MKSNKDQSTKQRAAGPEKSQDRPTHTELKTLKEDNVTTKAEQQQSSSSSQDIDGNNFDFDNEQLPVVELTTPHHGIHSTLDHMATVKQLQDTEKRVQHQATYIQELEFQLRLQEAYKENLLHATTISSLPSAPPAATPAGILSANELDIIQDEQAIQKLLESLALKKQATTHSLTCAHSS